MKTDVLIVGAGPTGLMAAALLARCGVQVRIIDKAKDQAHESRAIGVQARSLELFHHMGLVDEVLRRGMITRGLQLFINGKRRGQIPFGDMGRTDTPYPYLLMLSQAETENILVQDLEKRNIFVERSAEAISFEQTEHEVRTTFKNAQGGTETITSSYMIGADGAHSAVRKWLGLSFEGAPYAQLFELADVKVEWPFEHDRLCVFLHGTSFGAYFPMHGKEMGRVLAISSTENNDVDPSIIGSMAMTLDKIQKSFSNVTNVPTKLSNPTWLAQFHIHHRGVDRYRVGRVFVGGDSAHIHSPVGAQGMNTGLQDVANLCWKLAMVIQKKASETLLDTYQAERWPIGQKLLHFTDRFFSLIATRSFLLSHVRDFFFRMLAPTITRFPAARYRAFNFISQLGIRYHPNEFIRGERSSTLSPGYRAPNAKISSESQVFDLMKGYRFHLLALSKTAVDNRFSNLPDWIQIHRLENASVDVCKKYGLTDAKPQALYLIRPDGYIAYRSTSLDIENIKNFFD